MATYRKWLIAALLLVATGVGALVVYQWIKRPPALARLLPEGDRLAYLNLKPVRFFGDSSKSKPPQLEGDYREFVEQTGIQFERDLDEAAASWRETPDRRNVESAVIFAGRFDAARLKAYLKNLSTHSETYRTLTIYAVPQEGRTVRACILDDSRIAVTNAASVEPMHGIIDRLHHLPADSELLTSYYQYVPATSLAWIITRFPGGSSAPQLPDGLTFSFLENTVAVASLRYKGALLFHADVIAADEADAKKLMESATTFLSVYRTVDRSLGTKGTDADVKAALDSIRVEQNGNIAVFTATVSEKFLKKMLQEAEPEVMPGSAQAPSHQK